jgi:hypothetical protein
LSRICTGFVVSGAQCLVGVDPDDAQEGRDFAVQSLAGSTGIGDECDALAS